MYEFKELAKNVYAFVQPALIWHATAGVIVGDRDVTVVDSLTNEAMTRSLLEEIRKVTDKPVRLLINTQTHMRIMCTPITSFLRQQSYVHNGAEKKRGSFS